MPRSCSPAAWQTTTTAVGLANGGSTGVDVLVSIENAIGSTGADTIIGSEVANLLEGGLGDDKIWARGADDTVRGGDGNDVLVGGFGGNSGKPSGNDTMFGDAGNDELYGEDGNDILWGGKGSDQYAAGAGNDTLYFEADGESDTAWGGDERDTFVFQGKFGVDRIKDFLATGSESDKIDLRDFSVSFKDLKLVQAGSNTEISGFGGGRKIILEVVNAGALTAADFIFAKNSKSKGTNKNDKLVGGSGDDNIKGLKGNDTIKGKGGNDTLDGGGGADKLIGRPRRRYPEPAAAGGTPSSSSRRPTGSTRSPTLHPAATGWRFPLPASAAAWSPGRRRPSCASPISTAMSTAGAQGVFLFDNSGDDIGTIYFDANGGSSVDAVAFVRIDGTSLLESDFRIA